MGGQIGGAGCWEAGKGVSEGAGGRVRGCRGGKWGYGMGRG